MTTRKTAVGCFLQQPVRVIALFLALAFLAGSSSGEADHTRGLGLFDRLDRDLADGLIDSSQHALLSIKAIFKPGQLPGDYSALTASAPISHHHCGTARLAEIREKWNSIDEATKTEISFLLSRTETDSVYYTPGGFFKLHYELVGADSVPSEDLDFDEVPDFIERLGAYLDTSYTRHIELGYLMPPSDNGLGGDTLFDVYFQLIGVYGVAIPEGNGPEPWNDAYSHLVLHSTFDDLDFYVNGDPEGTIAGAAKSTAAHEFHHCVQYAYDVAEPSWYIEQDATHMEDIIFDHSNDNFQFLPAFMDQPEVALTDNSLHKYGSFVWSIFLAEKFDTTLARAAWEGGRYTAVFTALGDSLEGRYGWSTDSAIAEFALWNYLTDSRDDGQHYFEGSDYPPIAVGAVHSSYPVSISNSPTNVPGYAANYVEFLPSTTVGKLEVTFNGSNTRQWAAWLVLSSGPDSHTFRRMTLDPVSWSGADTVAEFENYERVALIGVCLSEFESGTRFTYSAKTLAPYALESHVVQTDSQVFAGRMREFSFQVNNVSPVNDVVDLIFWDSRGWVTLDTVDQAIASGDSALFLVPITAPVATPLGDTTTVFYRAESWGNRTVIDSTQQGAFTVLQRGDTDFNGFLDVADLVYFVEYSFNEGPPPQPILMSGDFDCTLEIDIADIVALIEYSFASGPYCPCNPY